MKKFFLLFLLAGTIAYGQKPVFATAKTEAATVYFNAAELTHTVNLNLSSGTSEVVVKNVANYLNENTVQIGAPATLTVLSVQFTRDYISEYEPDETSPAIKAVRDSIAIVNKELEKVVNAKISEIKILELLDKNNQVYGQDSGLSVDELMKMVDYYKTKRTETANAVNTLERKEKKLNEALASLNSKLEVNSSKAEKTSSGKLVLQVMNENAGNIPLSISYLTNLASWVPFYDLRVDNILQPVNMLYKGQVVQQTGIDWEKIKLTLSSGLPNQNSHVPLLHAWFLRFGIVQPLYDRANATVINSLQGQVAGLNITTASGAPGASAETIDKYVSINENQLSVSFDIDVPYDILSNGKKHSVTLKEIKLPATYKHYAVPRLENETFLLAEISDYSKYNLLRGEANIIFDGMYAGKTFIDPNSTADTLNLSMGRDKKVSVKREKVVDKSGSKFLSSYKEQTFTYDITIKNNKKEAITLTLKDQYPISTNKEIEVELLQSDNAKINKETGILTWELPLMAGESKKVRISYKVKYPKDNAISNL